MLLQIRTAALRQLIGVRMLLRRLVLATTSVGQEDEEAEEEVLRRRTLIHGIQILDSQFLGF